MQYPEYHYRWEWLLESSPEQLWPLVADTNRFNRDTGLPFVREAPGGTQPNARRRLRFSVLGVGIRWEEEPFEWVRPERFGVVRRYTSGPTASMRVLVDLTRRENGGTNLVYQVWVKPRTLLGLMGIPLFMRLNHRRFGSVFLQYDDVAQKMAAQAPRPAKAQFSAGGRERLASVRSALAEQSGEPALAARLCEAVEQGDSLSLARVRPYALADAWQAPRSKVVDLCLQATRLGLFDLQWDVMCPLCRGAKASAATLKGLQDTAHCDVCNIDFTANFERGVELTFKPNPAVRRVEAVAYCVAGPQITPHVVAQQLVAPGVRRDLTLPLDAGRYRFRALGVPGGRALVAGPGWTSELTLIASPAGWPSDELLISQTPKLHLMNETPAEQLLILERMAWTDQALTAAEVTCRQVFRDLFSREVLRPGEQISVGTLTVLFTDLRDSTRLYRNIGDAPAFGRVLDHFDVLQRCVVAEEGAVVKTIGDAIMAVFPRPVAALRAVLKAQRELAAPDEGRPPLYLKAGVHRGPCIAVTLNDRLDYFGSTVNLAARLVRFSSGEDVVLSQAVHGDPEVADFLSHPESRLAAERFEAQVKGFDEEAFPLWRVQRRRAG